MGMTPEQYWEQDSTLAIAYRKAYKLQQEQENRIAWLNGLYIWKALQSVAICVNGFVPNGVTIEPYWDKPYEFEKPKQTDNESREQKLNDTASYMQNLAVRLNAGFAKRNGQGG